MLAVGKSLWGGSTCGHVHRLARNVLLRQTIVRTLDLFWKKMGSPWEFWTEKQDDLTSILTKSFGCYLENEPWGMQVHDNPSERKSCTGLGSSSGGDEKRYILKIEPTEFLMDLM